MTANCYTNIATEFESPPYETGADVYRSVSQCEEQFTGIMNCWQSTGPTIVDVDDEEEGIVLQDSFAGKQENYSRVAGIPFSGNRTLPRPQLRNFMRGSIAADPRFKLRDTVPPATVSEGRFSSHTASDNLHDASVEDRRLITTWREDGDKRSHPTGRLVSRYNPSSFSNLDESRPDLHQRATGGGQNSSKSGRRYFAPKENDFSDPAVNEKDLSIPFRRHEYLKHPARQIDFATEPVVLPSTECNNFKKDEIVTSVRKTPLCYVTTEPMEIDVDDSEEGLLHEDLSQPSPVSKASASSSPGKIEVASAVKCSPRTDIAARLREKKFLGSLEHRSQSEIIAADSFLLSGQPQLLSNRLEEDDGVNGDDSAELDIICVNDDLQAVGLEGNRAVGKMDSRSDEVASDGEGRLVSRTSSTEKLKDQQMTDKYSMGSADSSDKQEEEIDAAKNDEEYDRESLQFSLQKRRADHNEFDRDGTEKAAAKFKRFKKKKDVKGSSSSRSRHKHKLSPMKKESAFPTREELKGLKERKSGGMDEQLQEVPKSARSSKKLQTKQEEHAQARDLKKTVHLKKAIAKMRRRAPSKFICSPMVMKSELRGEAATLGTSAESKSVFNPEEVFNCGLLLRYRVACEDMRKRICDLSSEYLELKATERQLLVEMGDDLSNNLTKILGMSTPYDNKFADLVAAAVSVSTIAKKGQHQDSAINESDIDIQPVKQKKRHKHGNSPS